MIPLVISSTGMVTGVGFNTASSCAAIRCGLNNFQETRFIDYSEGWHVASEVAFEESWRGPTKLAKMASSAIMECLKDCPYSLAELPLLLCLAEIDRPGRFYRLEQELRQKLECELGVSLHPNSRIISEGKIGGARALTYAESLLKNSPIPGCLLCGVDTFLNAATLNYYREQNRLLTGKNSNGFIPGEAAAVVLIERNYNTALKRLRCVGIGEGKEEAFLGSGKPLRADGLVQALRNAEKDSGRTIADTDYRITDVSGEHFFFKESTLLVSRTLRQLKKEYDILHPSDCIGNVGAAILPVILSTTKVANEKGYAPGPNALCHIGNDTGERAVLILEYA